VAVNLDLLTSGTWENIGTGEKICRLKLVCEGALALKMQFDKFYLPEGCELFLYNEEKSHVLGAYTSNNNYEAGVFSTELVKGDAIILEYYEPQEITTSPLLHISDIAYAYRNVSFMFGNTDDFGDSDYCQVNINCSPEGNNWQDEKRGVARILYKDGSYWYWCTGSLVNNTLEDGTPYFLTADHCGGSASTSDRNQWIFYFNYESTGCSTPGSSPGYNSKTGASLRARGDIDGGSDFQLVRINGTIPAYYNVYYNGWDRSGSSSSSGVGIHHPSGDIKKISTYSSTLTSATWNGSGYIGATNAHWRTSWIATTNGHGVSEGGSSGSPIFNSAGRVLGTLTGGSSSCSTPYWDLYGKFSYHWQSNGGSSAYQLEPWLDPNNSGVTYLDGWDPNDSNPPVADFEADITITAIGQTVSFSDLSIEGPTSWSWSFSPSTVTYVSGTSSSSQNPQVQFNAAGSYNVSLTATNTYGSDTETKTNYILVTAPPVANFTASTTTPSVGSTVTFTDESTNSPTSWVWSFSPATVTYMGGTTSNSPNPQVQFNAAGYYTVTLTATNVAGSDGETKTNYILASTAPVANFSADNIIPGLGQSVNFTDLSTGNPISWQWTFEGGDPSSWNGQSPPPIQYNTAGTWDVTLEISNGTATDVELRSDYIAVSGSAVSTATLSLPDVSVGVPGEIAVPLSLDAISSNLVVGIQVSFYYDPTYVTWMGTSSTPEDGISYINPALSPLGGDWLWNSLTGNLIFTWVDPALSGVSISPGNLLVFRYNYLGGLTLGESTPLTFSLTLKYADGAEEKIVNELTDENFQPYYLTLVNGSIINEGTKTVDLKVYLEGPYNGTNMTPQLTGVLPLTQPYNGSPWNYNGTESVSVIPADAIDWILVELRDASTAAQAMSGTRIGEQAGFLRNDGKIIDQAGNEWMTFDNTTINNSLYVVIHQRNHLSIMSSVGLTDNSGVYSYDFTTGSGQAYGGSNGQKELSPGVWGMFGGDGDHDGNIGSGDKSASWETEAGTKGYLPSDYNLDVESNNLDKDDIWVPNHGKGTQVPN